MNQLADLYRYPVKSLRGQRLAECSVEPRGLAGDRRWMIVNERGVFQTLRQHPAMSGIVVDEPADGLSIRLWQRDHGGIDILRPTEQASEGRRVRVWSDHVDTLDAGERAAEWLSAVLGMTVRLVYQSGDHSRHVDAEHAPNLHTPVSLADGFPLLLTTTGSLDILNAHLDTPVDMRCFRPNLVVDTDVGWLEDDWRLIRIGEIRCQVAKPCERCVVTTRDPDTGEQADSREPLGTLKALHADDRGRVIFGQNLIPLDTGRLHTGDSVEVLKSIV